MMLENILEDTVDHSLGASLSLSPFLNFMLFDLAFVVSCPFFVALVNAMLNIEMDWNL